MSNKESTGGGGSAGASEGNVSNASSVADIQFSTDVRARQQGPVHAANGRVVGAVWAGTFYKSVRANVHMLRLPLAWAFDFCSLHEAESLGAFLIRLNVTDTHKVFAANISTVWERGFPVDRGFGKQRALALCYWMEITEDGAGLAAQPSLFGTVMP